MSEIELVVRLLLSTLIGGLIGMEREATNRPAGLRTHVLVTVGSALIMMISRYGFMYGNSDVIIGDPARLAAGVVSGIGFLGAGTILQYGNRVKGLTTAASLWVCGGIGLAMGSGFYLGGIVTAAISMLTLRGLGIVEKSFMTKNTRILFVSFYERAGVIGEVGQILGRNDILIRDMRILGEDIEDAEEGKPVKRLVEATFNLKFPAVCSQSSFMTELLDVRGIVSAKWL